MIEEGQCKRKKMEKNNGGKPKNKHEKKNPNRPINKFFLHVQLVSHQNLFLFFPFLYFFSEIFGDF